MILCLEFYGKDRLTSFASRDSIGQKFCGPAPNIALDPIYRMNVLFIFIGSIWMSQSTMTLHWQGRYMHCCMFTCSLGVHQAA